MIAALLSPAARRDLLSASHWIAADNPVAAQGLRHSVVKAALRIGTHPEIGVLRPELADERYRFLTLSGFPYVIIYTAARQPPLIVRILHTARDMPKVLKGD